MSKDDSTPVRYQKKPPTFEAQQWVGTIESASALHLWLGGELRGRAPEIAVYKDGPILNLNGRTGAGIRVGDWVLKGASGDIEYILSEAGFRNDFEAVSS